MQYELSHWEYESFYRDIDVAVIGSGIVGLAAALHLKALRPTMNVAIIERGPLPVGASTRNAGFACFGSMTELMDDLTHMSEDDVLSVVEKRWRGLQALRQLAGDENMDYHGWGGYEMFTDEEENIFQACCERMPEFNEKIGRITGHPEVYRVADERLPKFGFKGARRLILNQAEGQVNTGRMMSALLAKAQAAGIRTINGLAIRRMHDEGSGVTLEMEPGWTIQVPKVLVCVNGFARQLLQRDDVWPARNQVLVTKPIPGLRVEGCFHYDRGYIYFRNLDGRILLGGGRNLDFEGEKKEDFGAHDRIREALTNFLHTVICPDEKPEIDRWWTGVMGLGPVKKPIIEQTSANVTIAVRMSGMGVAIGTLVGQQGAELLLKA
ncbi:MAG: FAD-binding oxidoreductase [Saprospiraceae bacterium]|nr:FAD-binding oxidoreductase [Saprospiraceae bacterium]